MATTKHKSGDNFKIKVQPPRPLKEVKEEVVVQLFHNGMTISDIGRMLGTNKSVISRIVKRKGRKLLANNKK